VAGDALDGVVSDMQAFDVAAATKSITVARA
jgi:hypothetical protein